jgi:hypothetical protein
MKGKFMEIGKLTNSIYSRANEDYSKFNNLSKILGIDNYNDISEAAYKNFCFNEIHEKDFMCRNFLENNRSKIKHFLKFIFILDKYESYIYSSFYDYFFRLREYSTGSYDLHRQRGIKIINTSYLGTFYELFNVYEIIYLSKYSSYSEKQYVGVKM